jgi:hypothetical protein
MKAKYSSPLKLCTKVSKSTLNANKKVRNKTKSVPCAKDGKENITYIHRDAHNGYIRVQV